MLNPIIKYAKYKESNQRGILREIHISDIHFGAIDPEKQYKILEEQFLNKIEQIFFDALYIDGDLFDHKFMSNSNTIMYATLFISRCIAICKQINATIVLLKGTFSHDDDQLRLFYHYLEDPYIDIRIVEQTKFEYIKGKVVLCIPEEYGRGREYYDSFLNSVYDGVVMHGTIRGSIHGADIADLDANRPVFDISDFKYCAGPIIAGHVHTAKCLNKHMYYTGCPIRYKFGEEEEKGFIILLHNLDTREYYAHFETITSFRYDTINLDDMIMGDPKNVIAYIKQLQAQGIDHIRVRFTKGDSSNINIIKSFYRNNQYVKIVDETNSTRHEETIKEINESYNKYAYLFDTTMTDYDKLVKYINDDKGYVFITSDDLIELLNEI